MDETSTFAEKKVQASYTPCSSAASGALIFAACFESRHLLEPGLEI